ncbi:unnamed protein product [Lymnaea stagnalis]|uniref:Uncharacterized protein n=1 Tax=Lymnaea stagnalis TaxID=6523 RepID=A0AAV2I8H5_LYMST
MTGQAVTASSSTWSVLARVRILALTLVALTGLSSGQLENAATVKRIYGTWQVRQNQRYCKQVVFCKYRAANCVNVTSDKVWTCNEINNEIAELGCVLRFCNGTNEICASTSPGPNYQEIPADTCTGQERCYRLVQPSPSPSTTGGTSGTPSVKPTQQSTGSTKGGTSRTTVTSAGTSRPSADVVWSTCHTGASGSQTPTTTEVSDITCPKKIDCESYKCQFINSDCSLEILSTNTRCADIARNYNSRCIVNGCANAGGKCMESSPTTHYTSGPCYSCPFGQSCYVT